MLVCLDVHACAWLQKPNFTSTYFSGGIILFSAGLMPLSSAFLEWIMKCLVDDKEETVDMNSPGKQPKVHYKIPETWSKYIIIEETIT